LFVKWGFVLALTATLVATMNDPTVGQPTEPPTVPSAVVQALSATDIYDRARAVVNGRTTPPFIVCHEDQWFSRKGRLQATHDDFIFRTADGQANLTPTPDSPRDKIDETPEVTTGLYPLTVFGLVKRKPGEKPSMYEVVSTPQPDPSPQGDIKVIGSVKTVAHDYDATLIGIETLDGASVYHLEMHPRFDPAHHPIRQLYVDTATFDPRRIAIEVYASAGPISSRPTIVFDYTPIEGNWLITHAFGDFVLRMGPFAFGGSIDYRASEYRFPSSEPDYLFDKKQLAAHMKEQAGKRL
jgi:hypothetical protein